jgi:hypothetical protein
MYASESLAEEALISAWTTYNYSSGNGPVGIYLCPDCGAYHLTSKGPMNKKLAEHLTTGKIQKSKEANSWMDKIKRKGKF